MKQDIYPAVARLENVSQHFGATTALRDITLTPALPLYGGPDWPRRRRQIPACCR
ncbi:Uncharacterised protein [Kluyvera cryocrescens]|uniref:Uncharacterized protein n=1 Tax=Kluyvera cryocrescens TaxID=580 RepID=A0A485BAN7_KLUCR|nr:Uncharacterised protein [Kluyvera cryocrescens]